MWVSIFYPNINCREARVDLADPYEMHKTIASRLSRGRYLWRLDNDNGRAVVLLQTPDRPSWTHLLGKFPEYIVELPVSRELKPDLVVNQKLIFRILCNPTLHLPRSFEEKDGKRKVMQGRYIGVYGQRQQEEWLRNKSGKLGFSVIKVMIQSREEKIRIRKRTVQLAVASFDGILKVTNPETFVETIRNGIGKSRAMGFGLLSLTSRFA